MDLTALTDDEARDLLARVYADVQRRDAIAQAHAQAEALATVYAAATADQHSEPYAAPTGAHDAYQTGDRVTYNGQIYESTIDNNVWEPGVYGWEETG